MRGCMSMVLFGRMEILHSTYTDVIVILFISFHFISFQHGTSKLFERFYCARGQWMEINAETQSMRLDTRL